MEKTENGSSLRAQKEIEEFVTLFPQVKPEEIPEEVWQKVKEGTALALAYAMHRNAGLEREILSLKSKKRGEALSAGSVSSAGATLEGGALAAYWDAYNM